ncbi:AAA family ATPase [Acidovorax lacteus]
MQQTLRRWEHPTAPGPAGAASTPGPLPAGDAGGRSAAAVTRPVVVHTLGFEGQALLWTAPGQPTARAALRYRKGVWLLGYAASNPGRLIYRESLAEWFWPGQDGSDGRRNLRVLLADVQQVLRQLGQAQALRVERDWVRWDHADRVRVHLPADMPPAPSTEGGAADAGPGDSVSEDFRAWWLGQDRAAAQQNTPSLRLVALLRVHWQRIDPRTSSADIGEGAYPSAEVQERVEALLARFGARTLATDSLASSFVVGLDSLSPSYRSAALQLAGGLHAVAQAAGLPARVGLCFGPVLVDGPGPVAGWRLRLVDRLAQVAEPGELVCDQSCADQAEFLHFDALGERSFRGFQRRFRLYRTPLAQLQDVMPVVLGQAHRALVGRDDTLAVLRTALRAASSGESRVVWLRGPSGMGKTRLAVELWRDQTAAHGGAAWIEGRPEAREQPWAALRAWVVQRLGARPHALAPGPLALLQGFCLTGSVGQTERHALRQAVAALVADGPLLWVLDDVQWIDEPSWQVLAWLMSERRQTLWLLTQRVASDAALPPAPADLPRLHTTSIDLPPLRDADALALWQAAHGEPLADLPPAARVQLQAARGRPLYLLCAEADGPAPHFAEYCQARCNALGAGREVLETAALLGLVWRVDDLSALVGDEAVSAVLETAVGMELLVPRGTEWMAFFHPTIREFLLDVQTAARLQQQAARVALLREHQREWALAAALWQRADDAARATTCWAQAALQAVEQDDHQAALTHFESLRACGYGGDADPSRAVALRLAHAQARLLVKGYGDPGVQQLADDLLSHAGASDAAAADPELDFGVRFLQYMGCSSNGSVDGLAQAADLWLRARTPAQRLVAAWAQGNTRLWHGNPGEALQWLETALSLESQTTLAERSALFVTDPLNFARAQWLWLRSLRGDDAEALARDTRQAEEQLRALPQTQDRCVYHCMAAFRSYTEGDFDAMARHASQSQAVAEQESFDLWAAIAALQWAVAQAHLGQRPDLEALAPRLHGLQVGYAAGVPTGQWMVADILRLSGQAQAALDLCAAWIADMPRQEHRHCLMDIHRIRAQCHTALGQHEEAAEAWAEAWAVAQSAGLKGWLQRWHGVAVVRGGHDD